MTYEELLAEKKTTILEEAISALAFVQDQLQALQTIMEEESQMVEDGE
tara:strand:- start:750 stop:893 length:144 start_codon:yes stop_codon:yes gene_type:complete